MLRKGPMRITEKHCSYRELCNSRLSWLKLGIVATTSSSMPFSWSLGQMQAGDSTQEWKSIFTSPKSHKWSLIIMTPEYFMLQWLCKLNIVFRDTEIWGLLLLNSKCISLHLKELLFCCHMETMRRANWRQSLVHVSFFVFLPPVTDRKRGKKFSRVGKGYLLHQQISKMQNLGSKMEYKCLIHLWNHLGSNCLWIREVLLKRSRSSLPWAFQEQKN